MTITSRNLFFRRLICFLLVMALVCAMPFAVMVSVLSQMEAQYGNTYYAALKTKFERLAHTEGSRIVVISGSSAAFGIDSKIIESELGIPCVNFGLYAALGLKCMLDMSRDYLHEGDIVIIAPELSTQMYSDYIGYEYLLQALEGEPEMYMALGVEYAAGFLEAMPRHIQEKLRFVRDGSPDPQGVYTAAAFDSYGDIIYDRPENIMDGMVSSDTPPMISQELVTDTFVEMINDYVKFAQRKNAKVYFDFCPMNSLSVDQETADFEGLQKLLQQKLLCPVLSTLEDHIMHEGYFYDSNYHLNNAGAVANSIMLVDNIKRELGNMSPTQLQIPEPVVNDTNTETLSSGVFEGFFYDITTQGAVITGLDESVMDQKELIIPESINGVSVYKIGNRAFENCGAEVIEIPETVSVLANALFADAKNLRTVYLHSERLPEVGEKLLDGASEEMMLCVPSSSYGDYVTDYFWARYAERITAE